MKKLIYLLLAIFILASCDIEKKQPQFSLTVNVDTLIDGNAYLQKREDGKWKKIDSAIISEGTFSMQGVIDYPVMYYVFIENIKKNIPVFLDQGDIQISVYTDDNNATSISGSLAQELYDQFQLEMKTYDTEMRGLYKRYRVVIC